jgi:hypothetical protein
MVNGRKGEQSCQFVFDIVTCHYTLGLGRAMRSKVKKSRYKWVTRLAVIGAGVAFVAVVAVAIAIALFVPAIVAKQVERRLSRYWQGQIEIAGIEVNYFDPLYLRDVTFRDERGRKWAEAQMIEITLADWPGLKPRIVGIQVDNLKLQIFVQPGLRLPLKSVPKAPGGPSKELRLPDIAIRQGTVSLVDQQGPKAVYDNVTFSVTRKDSAFEVLLSRTGSEASDFLAAGGTVDSKNLRANMALRLKHSFAKPEVAAIFAALGIPHLPAQGELAADLQLTGHLGRPKTLHPKGSVDLKDWIVEPNGVSSAQHFGANIRLDGPRVWLDNLSITDANDLPWFSAETSELTLQDWPGLHPALTAIDVEGLAVGAYLEDGKPRLPVDFAGRESAGLQSDWLALEKLSIRDGSVGVLNHTESRLTFDKLLVETAEQKGFYDVFLTRDDPNEQSKIAVQGLVNPSSREVKLSLQMNHMARKRQTAAVFAALGVPDFSAEGRLVADLSIAGDVNKPRRLQSEGAVQLEDWVLASKDTVIGEDLDAFARLDDRHIDINDFNVSLCSGDVNGVFFAQFQPDQPAEFGGRVSARNISLPELTFVLAGPEKKAAKGTVTLRYAFDAKGDYLETLRGEGAVFLDDADMTVVPVIPQIFRVAGLDSLDPLKMSDAEAVFTTTGPVVTIKSGHIANAFAAIEAEPGGTVNLKTEQVDGHVVVAPLKQIDAIIKRIPVINILGNLKDKLTRLRVKGRWSDPPPTLISKEPIRDIRDATVGFLQDVIKSGGQFSQETLGRVGIGPRKREDVNR